MIKTTSENILPQAKRAAHWSSKGLVQLTSRAPLD